MTAVTSYENALLGSLVPILLSDPGNSEIRGSLAIQRRTRGIIVYCIINILINDIFRLKIHESIINLAKAIFSGRFPNRVLKMCSSN